MQPFGVAGPAGNGRGAAIEEVSPQACEIIRADRCREKTTSVKGEVIDLWYSGKGHCHGGNVQAVFAPGGFPLRVSGAEPGSVHDITAARRTPCPGCTRRQRPGLPPWPTRVTTARASARAALVLTHFEHGLHRAKIAEITSVTRRGAPGCLPGCDGGDTPVRREHGGLPAAA